VSVSASGSVVHGGEDMTVAARLVIDSSGTVRCERCGHGLGPTGENYKEHAVRKDRPIEAANPRIVDPALFIDREVTFRQYFCPGCATALENEVILADSEPVWDKQIA
jgi:N-methylhydantoinase B